MKTRFFLTSMAFIVAMVLSQHPLAAQEPESFDQFRVWKDATKQQELTARLVDYNPDTEMVRLESGDGQTYDLRLDQLSRADRRWVQRMYRKNKDAMKVTAGSDKAGNSNTDADDSGFAQNANPKTKRTGTLNRYGVNWIRDVDQASKLARGDVENPQDDRPIMWFRVLGDLEGFM